MVKSKKHCCENMEEQVSYQCGVHSNSFDCPETLIYFCERFDEYGIIIHNGVNSYSLLKFCPWCGVKLPHSRRDEWFDRLLALGYDNPWEQDIPKEFLSDSWYTNSPPHLGVV